MSKIKLYAFLVIVHATTVLVQDQINVIVVIVQTIKDISPMGSVYVVQTMLMSLGFVKWEFEHHVKKKDMSWILNYNSASKVVEKE